VKRKLKRATQKLPLYPWRVSPPLRLLSIKIITLKEERRLNPRIFFQFNKFFKRRFLKFRTSSFLFN
jgi:hypothetical protein